VDREPGKPDEPSRAALEGPQHPLVTIRFWRTVTADHPEPWSADRYWYHVPRQGEYVDFGDGIAGKVDMVFWGDNHVTVRFR
jgi:hypothetical protein